MEVLLEFAEAGETSLEELEKELKTIPKEVIVILFFLIEIGMLWESKLLILKIILMEL